MLHAVVASPLTLVEAKQIIAHTDEGHLDLDDAEVARIVNEARRLCLHAELWGSPPRSSHRRFYRRAVVIAAVYLAVAATVLIIPLLNQVNA